MDALNNGGRILGDVRACLFEILLQACSPRSFKSKLFECIAVAFDDGAVGVEVVNLGGSKKKRTNKGSGMVPNLSIQAGLSAVGCPVIRAVESVEVDSVSSLACSQHQQLRCLRSKRRRRRGRWQRQSHRCCGS